MSLTTTSIAFLAQDRIRVTYDPASVVTLPITGTAAGFAVVANSVAVPILRIELSSPYTIDLMLSAPVYAGESPTLAYTATPGVVQDAAGTLAATFSATAITATVLPAIPTGVVGVETEFVPAGGRPNHLILHLDPGVTHTVAIQSSTSGVVTLIAALVADNDSLSSTATLTVQSSPDNGIKTAYSNQVVRSESGVSSATPAIPIGAHARFTIESQTNPYLQFTSNVAMMLTLESRAPMQRLNPGTP